MPNDQHPSLQVTKEENATLKMEAEIWSEVAASRESWQPPNVEGQGTDGPPAPPPEPPGKSAPASALTVLRPRSGERARFRCDEPRGPGSCAPAAAGSTRSRAPVPTARAPRPPHGPEQPGGAGPPCPGLTGALSGRHTSHGPSPRAAVSFPGDTQLSLAFLPLGAGAQCLSAPGRVCEDSQTPFHRRHGNLGTGRHGSDLPCVPSLVRRGFEGGICHLTQYPERPSATLPLRQGRPRPTFSRPWHPPKSALRLPLAVLAPESCAAACLGEEPERIDSQTL